MTVSNESLRTARDTHKRVRGLASVQEIDRKFGIPNRTGEGLGVDFDVIANDEERAELLAAYRGDKASAPRSIAEIDTAAVYTKWNSAGRNCKAKDDEIASA